MTALSPLVGRLMQALRCLPGVGPRSAQRMAFHLLEKDRKGAQLLVDVLSEALEKVQRCTQCRTLSETPACPICSNSRRDRSLLCIVETPADIQAIEQTADYNGLYFVLMGRLSPLDGIGPREIGLDALTHRLRTASVREVILATNPTLEGEATAHYISELMHQAGIRVTRLAHGIPMGGELEFVDSSTLSHALNGRREM